MNAKVLVAVLASFAGVLACSGPEPKSTPYTDKPAPSEPASDGADETDDETDTTDNAGQTPTLPAAEAGAPAGPGDAFTGADAFAAKLGMSARKPKHPFANDNPAGKSCFECHGSTAPAFAFAGTVYANAAGTTPAAKVEVRMRDSSGKAISASSDADGNFYFLLDPNGDLGDLANAGLRNGKGTKLMSSTVAVGDCNGCHKAGGAGRLVAPK